MSTQTVDIGRDIVAIGDFGSGRVYWDRGIEPLSPYPSVTTITGSRDDPQKDRALKGWRLKYSGEGDKPYWKHIQKYSQWRGTLLHWYFLSTLDSSLPATHEEREAISNIEDRQKNYDFINSIAQNHDDYTTENFPSKVMWLDQANNAAKDDPLTLTDIFEDDYDWFMETAPSMLDIDVSDVIAVEAKVVNHDYKFGGQFDLLYDDNGTTTLMDVKTGKSVYWGAKRQLEAYARTIEDSDRFPVETVDEYIVLRANPDRETREVSRLSEWDESRDALWADFCLLNERVQPHVSDIDTSELQ